MILFAFTERRIFYYPLQNKFSGLFEKCAAARRWISNLFTFDIIGNMFRGVVGAFSFSFFSHTELYTEAL
jgi:hypothetical protein